VLQVIAETACASIFYGPPGSGKTTLARIVAASTGAAKGRPCRRP
jgi:replication-associated recombination protein RarA